MAKHKKTLNQLLEGKLSFLSRSEKKLLDGVGSTEKAIYAKVLKILRSLSQEEGRLASGQASTRLLTRLRRDLLKVIRESAFIPKVSGFLTDFDEVERRNRTIYQRILGKPIRVNLSVEKKIIIDGVVDSLTGASSLNANYTNPIRKVLTDAIREKQTFAQANTALKNLIVGTANGGLFKKFTRQVTVDAINGFDGAVNDVIRDAFQLDGFRYVGSLIKDSRLNCQEWVNGSGKFKKFAVDGGVFRVKDLKKMIKIAKKRPGWKKGTTPTNFAQNRGGWNCRHQVFYFLLTEKQDAKVNKQLGK